MSDRCYGCRFLTMTGCRAGICGESRAALREIGITSFHRPFTQLRPEPVGKGGLAGRVVEYGTDRRREFPPTLRGMEDALTFMNYMKRIGVEIKYSEIRQDPDLPEAMKQPAAAI